MFKSLQRAVPLFTFLFVSSCIGPEKELVTGGSTVYLSKEKELVVNDDRDQLGRMWVDVQVIDDLNVIYGRDPNNRKIYRLSMESGSLEFISSNGRGPEEMMHPMQITIKNSDEFYAYDGSLDQISHFVNEKIENKISGYLHHEVWTRSHLGFYWKNHIITGIDDYFRVQSNNCDEAQPLALLDLEHQTLTKHGTISPTVNCLVKSENFPQLYLDINSEVVYYIYHNDYTLMAYDLTNDSTYVASSFKPANIRIPTTSASSEATGWDPMDISILVGLHATEEYLVAAWYNMTEEYLDGYDPKDLEIYGVLYDLPSFDNPREFHLSGRLLGTYNNYILVEENDDPKKYTIGFYIVDK